MAQFSRLDVLNTMIDTSQLPIFDAADVVVVGSGSAGAVAAIASARAGAETLLIERYGFLGGTSTMVLSLQELQARLLSAGVLLAGARV